MKFCSGRWMVAAVAIVMLAAAAGTGCKKASGPFPASGAVAGWVKTSDTRVFAAKDLWHYIDGEAERYLAAGVVSASTADYEYQGQAVAIVDVYTMGDAAGARKILETGTDEANPVQLGDAGVAYAESVAFRKGPYLVRIVAVTYGSSAGIQQALLALARGVEAKM